MIRFVTLHSLAVLALFLFVPAAAAQRPAVEAFGNLPLVDDMQLSPDGRHVAVLRRHEGRRVVLLGPISGGLDEAKIFTFDEGSIEGMFWANADRLLIHIEKQTRYAFGEEEHDFTRVVSVSASGGKTRTLFRRGSPYKSSSHYQVNAWVVGRLPHDPENVLMPFVDERGRVGLYKVNVETGRTARVEPGAPDTWDWQADHAGERLLRLDIRKKTGDAEYLVKLPGGDWESILTFKWGSGEKPFDPLAFAERPDRLYVSALHNGRDAIFEYDLKAKKLDRLVFAHEQADVDGIEMDDRTGALYAAHYVVHEPQVEYFDAGRAALQKKIDRSFPSTSVNRIISSTDDRTAHIIVTSGPSAPKRYFYFNVAKNAAREIAGAYPELDGAPLASVQVITYKARDGLEIPAYLTLPHGVTPQNLPLVALPHGGPQSRDVMTFDYWAQFLASRGYAVLQPQFRGSEGFGDEFAEAGENEWGGKMQDDVTDGVLHLIAQGVADKNRICVMGGSYGGYAAMMGAVKTPDLYKCAVSVAGVSDLLNMLADERRELSIHYWRRHIGDPSKDRDRLAAASPARQVDKIKIPILLIHGKDDLVVPVDQSRHMARRLRQAGKPHKLVELEGEDHYLTFGETRIAMLREAEAFLAQHLGSGASAAAR